MPMKSLISFLAILSIGYTPIKAQEVRKSKKSVNCTIGGTEKKVLNQYETSYITTYSVAGETFKLEVIILNPSGRISRIMAYRATNLGLIYTSLSEVPETRDEETGNTTYQTSNEIEDADDGSVISTNAQYGSALKILKMDNGFYKVLRLITSNRTGDEEITDFIYAVAIKKHLANH